MKEIYYIYNNEAIASCIFLSILQKTKELNAARACLILPFLLDDRTVNYLNRQEENPTTGLEQLIKEHPRLFVSFNKRYLSLLPIAINSLVMLENGNQIRIGNAIQIKSDINIDNIDNLGERFSKIKKAIPQLLKLMENYTTTKLYETLNIQL